MKKTKAILQKLHYAGISPKEVLWLIDPMMLECMDLLQKNGNNLKTLVSVISDCGLDRDDDEDADLLYDKLQNHYESHGDDAIRRVVEYLWCAEHAEYEQEYNTETASCTPIECLKPSIYKQLRIIQRNNNL